MAGNARCAACCDIGGTKALLGLVDEQGRILARERYLLGAERDPRRMVSDLVSHLQGLAAACDLPWDAVAGIGCSAAVMADVDRGIILSAPNLLAHHRNVPFRDLLAEASGRPALIEMDAYAAALGEAWLGVGVGVGYFAYVVVGTGIGAGILMRGVVFRGWHGTAGEFGHATIDPNGPLCNCGRYGCLEALAAGPAIALRAQGALLQGRKSLLPGLAAGRDIGPELVFQAARLGDELAQDVVRQTVEWLGIGLSNLIHILDPEVIGLGGGVVAGGTDLLLEPLRREVALRCGSWVDVAGMRILQAALGEDAALLGVARLIWQRARANSNSV